MAHEPYESDFSLGERAPDAWHRMGMHDFTEHYGRYSGGDPYGYEYSERSVEHRHPRYRAGTGFTRGLARRGDERGAPTYTRGSTRREEARTSRARPSHREEAYRERAASTQERPLRRDRRRRPRGAPWARRLHERRARRHGFDARGYTERDDEGREDREREVAPRQRHPRYGREYGYGAEYRAGRPSRSQEFGRHDPDRYPYRGHERSRERGARPRQDRRRGRGQRWYEPRDPW